MALKLERMKRKLKRVLNYWFGFNLWEIHYADENSDGIRSFYIFHSRLHLPRIGDHVDFNKTEDVSQMRDWVVIDVFHSLDQKEILIFLDDFNIYKPLLRKDYNMIQLLEDRKRAHAKQ